MAGSVTTAFPTSEKAELLEAGHCFNATVTPTGTVSSGAQTVTGMSSIAGIAVGMSVVSGSSFSALCVVESVVSTTSITVSRTAAGAITGGTLTISGDAFKIALIIPSPTGTYNASTTNYTNVTGNSDEVANGNGYTTGGVLLTNVTATTSGTGANTNFSPNPSWTSATFSTTGALIYNTSTRVFGTSGTNTTGGGRAVGVYSFGGTQSVTSGTLTVLMPSPPTPSNAVIAIQ